MERQEGCPRQSRRDQKIYRRQALTCWATQYRLRWDLWHARLKCATSYCLYLQQMKTLLRTSGVWAENGAVGVSGSFLLCDGQGSCLRSVKPSDADKRKARVTGRRTLVSGRSVTGGVTEKINRLFSSVSSLKNIDNNLVGLPWALNVIMCAKCFTQHLAQ